MNDDAPLLEVRDLVVTYPVRCGIVGGLLRRPRKVVHAVDGVSLTVRRGEMLALVGESGCGKTTTAQAVLGMVRLVSGSIRFDGEDVIASDARSLRPVRRRMQLIYQDPYESLDPRFRVRTTVEEPMVVHGVGGSRGARGTIAAGLVLDPELLVADEPVSMLDVSVRAGVLSLIDGLRRRSGVGVLMITHDLSTAAHYADRIAVMYLGRIVEEGPTREVVRVPRHPYTTALLSVVPKRDPRQRSEPQVLVGETPNPVDVPSGCRFHPQCPVAEERCRTIDPELRPAGSGGHRAACVLVGA